MFIKSHIFLEIDKNFNRQNDHKDHHIKQKEQIIHKVDKIN